MRRSSGLRAAYVFLLLAACSSSNDDGGGPTPPRSSPEATPEPAFAADPVEQVLLAEVRAKVSPAVLSAVARGERRDVLVVLDDAAFADRVGLQDVLAGEAGVEVRAALYAEARRELEDAAAARAMAPTRTYRYAPVVAWSVGTADELAVLAHHRGTLRVVEDETYTHMLAESLPLVGQPTVQAEGKTGAGTAVAVLDTGCDYTKTAFGSCSSAGASGCKVAYAQDFAPDDGALDADGHGTNVSAIVLGVAPAAKVLALDVFAGSTASSTTILQAIDWVIAHRASYNIVAMNMSFGASRYTSTCPDNVFASAIANARTAGILTAAAAGNDGSSSSLSSPGCTPAAISVGAVYDANVGGLAYSMCTDATTAADRITCFSNSAPFLSVLAPGAIITAGGFRMAGTSQASPHVAGAVALLKGAYPSESPDQIAARLMRSRTSIRDPRNGITKPRLDLPAAAADCSMTVTPATAMVGNAAGTFTLDVTTGNTCTWTAASGATWLTVTNGASGTGPGKVQLAYASNPTPTQSRSATVTVGAKQVSVQQGADTTGPVGKVTINAGAPATRTRAVTLTLEASDPSGVASMCVSNTTSCSTWEAFATSKAWTLPSAAGTQTVTAWFKDVYGNVSTATDTIVLDDVAPTDGTLTAKPGNAQVALSWTGFTDALTGVSAYAVVAAAGTTTPPSSCASGTRVYTGAGTSFTHAGLTNGTLYAYRVCATDGVGNASAGATANALPRPETTAPTGSISISAGIARTATAQVTLGLVANDASGVASMCISGGTTCSSWEPFASTKPWTLVEGPNTVRAWFRDVWANVSAPVSASITLDSSGPSLGSFSATPYGGDVFLVWSGASDPSGVAAFKLVYGASEPAAGCTSGTPLDAGGVTCAAGTACSAASRWHRGAPKGTTYYRLCAVDSLGNTNAGLVRSAAIP